VGGVLLAALGLVATVFTVIAGIHGLQSMIDARVDEAVSNPEFVRRVATHVRPYLIFDVNATIHADMGAGQYLDDLTVEFTPYVQGKQTMIITVTPKEHLAYTPIIEPMGAYEVAMISERGEGHSFIYELAFVMWPDGKKKDARFRLEVLR